MDHQLGGVARALRALRGELDDVDPPSVSGCAFRAVPNAGTSRCPGRAPLADVYLPDGPGPHPSVIWVHGGGFAVGSRGMKPIRYLATACRRAGYAVLSFDYRLLFRGGGLAPAVDDVQTATRWWLAQAERFNLQVDRVAMGGLSAGGCLALLSAQGRSTQGRVDPVRAYISLFALYDIGAMGGLSQVLARLVAGPNKQARTALSPMAQPPIERPMLLMHGGRDVVVPVAQAQAYARTREALNLPTQVEIYEGGCHGFFSDPTAPIAAEGAQRLLKFLDEVL